MTAPIKYVIYALIDPNTDEIRYIGYTYNLRKRYNEHYYPSKLEGNTHKNNWIKSLLKEGKKAKIEIICEYDNADILPQAEKMWISNYRILGCDLTNTTDGGDGQSIGFKPSKETIEKLRVLNSGSNNAMYGKHHTDETKQKISKSKLEQKLKYSDAEKQKKSLLMKKISKNRKRNAKGHFTK